LDVFKALGSCLLRNDIRKKTLKTFLLIPNQVGDEEEREISCLRWRNIRKNNLKY